MCFYFCQPEVNLYRITVCFISSDTHICLYNHHVLLSIKKQPELSAFDSFVCLCHFDIIQKQNSIMKKLIVIFSWLSVFVLFGCHTQKELVSTNKSFQKTLILVSMDGFRHDYFNKANTPGLDEVIKHGVKAEALIPSFPSKTFPNHLSIITGMYPEHHGIISNRMYDDKIDEWYKLGNSKAVTDGKWYKGEPFWVTAEKQHLKTAIYFWPGSEAEINGFRPTYWKHYDESIPYADRVKQVMAWLDMPSGKRPRFISLYFDEPDHSGHEFGPDSPEVVAAIERVDSNIVLLEKGIAERNLTDKVDVIIVSDHGMTPLSRDSVIFLDDYINIKDVEIIDWSPVIAIRPKEGKKETVYKSLKNAHPKLAIYKKGEVPKKFHYNDNPLIQPIVGITALGWTVTTKKYFKSHKNKATGGTHGYDPAYADMHTIFIAKGPSFKKGITVKPFENVHIYELMCRVLKIKPSPNDGTFKKTKFFLTKE